jgi:hypothetical protein
LELLPALASQALQSSIMKPHGLKVKAIYLLYTVL